jgi:hypothetical protein
MHSFNLAQSFFIDKGLVQNAPSVRIAAVDLYFKSKPSATENFSGVNTPGVTVFIVPTIYGVPKLNKNDEYELSRLPYAQILTSSDATAATRFRFHMPVSVSTDREFALVVSYDGNAPFVLWNSVQGDLLLNSTTISPGPSGKYTGSYFEFVSSASDSTDQDTSNSYLNEDDYKRNWNALSDTDLKYQICVARYSHSGYAVSANVTLPVDVPVIGRHPAGTGAVFGNGQFDVPSTKMEYLIFDEATSTKESFVGGQMAYQNTFYYPGGISGGNTAARVSVDNSTLIVGAATFPNGQSFDWNSIFNNYAGDKWIVLFDTSFVNVRKITNIVNTSVIQVTEPVTFSNTSAKFMITPVGRINSFNKSSPFGISDSMVMLSGSSANATMRFVNSTCESIAVGSGGTGYSNANILYVNGFENIPGVVEGGYKAIGNVVTNTSGGITAVYLSNAGCGFTNSSLITIAISNGTSSNTTSNTTLGTGATFFAAVGASLRTELRPDNNFRNIRPVNFPISDIVPFFEIENPAGSNYDLQLKTQYYRTPYANALGQFDEQRYLSVSVPQ